MAGNRILLFIVLLVVLGAVVYTRVLPNKDRLRKSLQSETVEKKEVVIRFSKDAVLKDGSFNPLPPKKMPIDSDPATLVAGDHWRERYEPLLAAVQPPASAPGFYVYPFLDRTTEGVGLRCTYGWHAVGSAALALKTGARVVDEMPPDHYGLIKLEDILAGGYPSAEEWKRRALADPATKNARYIVTGIYESDEPTSSCSFKILLIDREAKADAPANELVTAKVPLPSRFTEHAVAHRRGALEMAQKLVESGIAPKHAVAKTGGLKLNNELREVAQLLDANDSWAVMDGVDRALQLAALFPDSTLPLQAASYGMSELMCMMMAYGFGSLYEEEYSTRAYALAQIAAAIDDKPRMTQLAWIFGARTAGLPPDKAMSAFPPPNSETDPPELDGMLSAARSDYDPNRGLANVEQVPDWQVLMLEAGQSYYIMDSRYRKYFLSRLPFWETHDFYLQARIQNEHGDVYQTSSYTAFANKRHASIIAARHTIATELAALLVTIPTSAAAKDLPEQLTSVLGDQVTAISTPAATPSSAAANAQAPPPSAATVSTSTFGSLAAKGDYYQLRSDLLKLTEGWTEPYQSVHACYRLLLLSEPVGQAAMADAKLRVAPSGFAGFEFSPSERIRFARRRDQLGPDLLVNFEGKAHGDYDAMYGVAQNYARVRPGNASATSDLLEVMKRPSPGAKDSQVFQAMARKIYDQYPLSSNGIYNLAYASFSETSSTQASLMLHLYAHEHAFNPTAAMKIGNLYDDAGYNGEAVAYYDRFLLDMPARHDIAIKRAWALCQMGHALEPATREVFARAVRELPGNDTFQEDNLRYLLYWAIDLPAARKAADSYTQYAPPGSAVLWQARIEAEDNNTTKALQYIRAARIPSQLGLRAAIAHANLAELCIGMGQLDEAARQVAAAASIDDWQGNVIRAMGHLAFAQGKYDEAAAEFKRCIARYGDNASDRQSIIACEQKKKGVKPEELIPIVEAALLAGESGSEEGIPGLIEHYASQKGSRRPAIYFNMLLKSPQRYRVLVRNAINAYALVDSEVAAEATRHIDDIMREPTYSVPVPPAPAEDGATSGSASGAKSQTAAAR